MDYNLDKINSSINSLIYNHEYANAKKTILSLLEKSTTEKMRFSLLLELLEIYNLTKEEDKAKSIIKELEEFLKTAKEVSVYDKVNMYISISKTYINFSLYDSSHVYLDKAKSCLENTEENMYLLFSKYYNTLGQYYYYIKEYIESLESYYSALDVLFSNKESKLALADTYLNIIITLEKLPKKDYERIDDLLQTVDSIISCCKTKNYEYAALCEKMSDVLDMFGYENKKQTFKVEVKNSLLHF